MMSRFLKLISLSAISILFYQCSIFSNPFAEKNNNGNQDAVLLLALAGLASGGGSRTVEETRPFRARTVTLKENGSVHVYDWNQDRESQLREEDTPITGIEKIWSSESGRFTYAKVGNEFRVIDSTINLSPHSDHFHYDRANYYRTIAPARFASPGLTAPNNTTPHSVRARDGWVAFFYRGNTGTSAPSVVRFVKESQIVTESSIPVVAGPTLGNEVGGDAILMGEKFALVPDVGGANGPTELKIYNNINAIGDPPNWGAGIATINCTDYKGMATTQIPKPGANFTNLESGYDKIHYALILCLGDNKLVRYEDGGADPTVESWNIDGGVGLTRVQALYNNDNIERGGRNTKPIFIGNAGTGNQDGFYILDATDKSSRFVPTETYPNYLIGSETRLGGEVYIVSSNGKLITYNSGNGSKVREMDIGIPASELGNARFYSTWQAGFLTHNSTIHEYNIQEDFKARTIETGNKIQQLSIKGFFGSGADYTGPEHSLRNKKKGN